MEIGKIEQLEVDEAPDEFLARIIKDVKQVVAVDPPNKCCETCIFRLPGRGCMNVCTPVVSFQGFGDPAEFWCNHWQQKEE